MLLPSMLVTGATPKSPLVMITSGEKSLAGHDTLGVDTVDTVDKEKCGKNVENARANLTRLYIHGMENSTSNYTGG